MRELIFITSLIAVASCNDKLINEVPEHCYDEIYAKMWVDSVEQSILDEVNPLTQINDNYLFGAAPLGTWDFTLETDSFFMAFNSHIRIITEDEYLAMSHQEWKDAIESRGKYNIKDTRWVTRTTFYSKNENDITYWVREPTDDELLDGEVVLTTSQEGDCHFINVYIKAIIKKTESENYVLEAAMKDAYGPLTIND